MHTELPAAIRSEGWHNWGRPWAEAKFRYAEYGNTGPGADLSNRVAWSRELSEAEAEDLTSHAVLGRVDGWNPAATESIPYNP